MPESKLVLVKDISELAPGVRIKVINCSWCNKTHKFITLNTSHQANLATPTRIISEEATQVYPLPPCNNGSLRWWICVSCIQQKRVFKYLDLDDIYESDELRKNKLCEDMATRKLVKT